MTKYKFDIWYKAGKSGISFLDSIEVDAESEKDATDMVGRIACSRIQLEYKPVIKTINIGKTLL